MNSFLENILHSDAAGNIIEAAKEKLQSGSLGEALDKIGIGSGKLGELATGVINVIGLAGDAFGKKNEDEEESADEESNETE